MPSTAQPLELDVASAGDEDALALVGRATFLETYAGTLTAADILAHCAQQHAAEVYRRWLDDERSRCWLARAREGGAPVGYLVVAAAGVPVADPHPADLEIKRVYLLHRFQRCGMGRRMIEVAAEHARQVGCPRLLLGVYSGNHAALAFYERMGFKRVGERIFRVGASDFHDYVLGLVLA